MAIILYDETMFFCCENWFNPSIGNGGLLEEFIFVLNSVDDEIRDCLTCSISFGILNCPELLKCKFLWLASSFVYCRSFHFSIDCRKQTNVKYKICFVLHHMREY